MLRADRLLAAPLGQRREQFNSASAYGDASFAKAGAYGGSAHRQHKQAEFAQELRDRSALILKAILDSHEAMSASASPEQRPAYKDWLATKVAAESTQLGVLYLTQVRLEGTDPKNVLLQEAQRQIETAKGQLDNALDKILHNYVVRFTRWLSRGARIVLVFFGHGGPP